MTKKINKIVKNNSSLFFNYFIIGVIATIVDLGLLFVLTEFFKIWYLLSVAIACIVGMLTNYIINKKFNFKNKSKKIALQFGLFFSVALTSIVLNLVIVFILVEFFTLWYLLAKVISTLIVFSWSFYWHKNITFKILK